MQKLDNINSPVFPYKPKSSVEAIDDLLIYAVYLRASDVHCDPRQDGVYVRLRIDGQISDAGVLPIDLHDGFIARLKILSGARTDIHYLPQDGRWRTSILECYYNIRISFMPTYYGENAVLRILPTKVSTDISFSKLGFTPDHVISISEALNKKHGLILVTGPTGSGKTTTLHTCLSSKTKESLSIITLEDPVEYEMFGIRQIHIRHSQGVTFASGLRSALRQDPDIIMVGEIRDSETAKIVIHTALTGHLVLSTIHTNSALETIPRLLDMGVDHYLLASTLKLIIAQRLIRTTCIGCHGIGCNICSFSGYAGRSVIAEVLSVDSGLAQLIEKKDTSIAYEQYARSKGFRPIEEDGKEKVEWGVTTREEIINVLSN